MSRLSFPIFYFPLFNMLLNRTFLVANITALTAILLVVYFPASNNIELPILTLGAFVLLPAITLRFILKRPAAKYGLSLGNRPIFTSSLLTFGALAIFSIISFFLIAKTGFGKSLFRVNQDIQENFILFLIHASLLFWTIAANEYFFRGFILFTWKHTSSTASIFASTLSVAFYSLLSTLHTGHTFSLSTFITVILLAASSSIIAFFTGSLVFSFCFSFFSAILATVFTIVLT